jgi:hypothetical protein
VAVASLLDNTSLDIENERHYKEVKEHLPSKLEGPNSNPNTAKNRR